MPSVRVNLLLSAFLLLIFGMVGAQKASAEEIAVHAVVPLSSEYAFTMQKNSFVEIDSANVAAGGVAKVTLHLRAYRDEPLQRHRVAVVQRDLSGTVVGTVLGETDMNGCVSLLVPTRQTMRERYRIGWEDRTYGRPVGVVNAGYLRVLAPRDESSDTSKRTGDKEAPKATNYAIIQGVRAWSPPGVNAMLELHESNSESQLEKGGPIADNGIGCASRGGVLSSDTS